MDQKPRNVVLICSDQHNRHMAGCYGNPHVITPHMDALAAAGTRFDCAYTPNPICVPARASMATGCYSHTLHCWDNASPYCSPEQALSFGHQLHRAGIPVTPSESFTTAPARMIPVFPTSGFPSTSGTAWWIFSAPSGTMVW